MNIDNVIKLIDSVAKLLGAIIWPAIALFVLWRFGPALREFIANMSEFSLKAPGIEASGRRQQVEAAAALAAASVSHPDAAASPETAARDARAAVQVVADVVTPRVMRRAGQSTILWVDDRPNGNVNERQSVRSSWHQHRPLHLDGRCARQSLNVAPSMPSSQICAVPLIHRQGTHSSINSE